MLVTVLKLALPIVSAAMIISVMSVSMMRLTTRVAPVSRE